MPHDKISAAARRRMAEAGEPYAAARRAVIRDLLSLADPDGFIAAAQGHRLTPDR